MPFVKDKDISLKVEISWPRAHDIQRFVAIFVTTIGTPVRIYKTVVVPENDIQTNTQKEISDAILQAVNEVLDNFDKALDVQCECGRRFSTVHSRFLQPLEEDANDK